jgi:hypothetical protein
MCLSDVWAFWQPCSSFVNRGNIPFFHSGSSPRGVNHLYHFYYNFPFGKQGGSERQTDSSFEILCIYASLRTLRNKTFGDDRTEKVPFAYGVT